MNPLQYLMTILIILLAVPLGFLLSKTTKEELKAGRIAFRIIIAVTLVIIMATFFLKLNLDSKIFISSSMLFIMILAMLSLRNSYKQAKTKKNKTKESGKRKG